VVCQGTVCVTGKVRKHVDWSKGLQTKCDKKRKRLKEKKGAARVRFKLQRRCVILNP